MSCVGEGATHHAACDCREAAHREEVARLRLHVTHLQAERDMVASVAREAEAEVARLHALLEAAEVDKIRILDILDEANWESAESVAGTVDLVRAIAGDRPTSAPPTPQK